MLLYEKIIVTASKMIEFDYFKSKIPAEYVTVRRN